MPRSSVIIPKETSALPHQTGDVLCLFGENTLWLLLDRGLLSAGTMVAGLLLVRYLGPADFGLYSLAVSSGGIAGAALDLGLSRYAARTIAAEPGEAGIVIALSVIICVASVVVESLLILCALTLGLRGTACVFAGLILGSVQRLATLTAFILTAELRSKAVMRGAWINRVGTIATVGLAVWKHLDVFQVTLVMGLLSFPVPLVRLIQLRTHLPDLRYWRRITPFRNLVIKSWPFYSQSLIEIGYGQFGIVAFSLVATREEVGWFAAALVIAGVFPQWSYAASDALLPIMTRLFEGGRREELVEVRKRLLDVFVLLTTPVIVVLAVYAPQICTSLGANYNHSAPALRIVGFRTGLLVVEGLLGGAFLTAINRVRDRRNAIINALIVMVFSTLVLGRCFGAPGAATALLITDCAIVFQYMRILGREWLGFDSSAVTWACIPAGVAMAFFGWKLEAEMSWLLATLFSLFVYVAVVSFAAPRRVVAAGRTVKQCLVGT